MRCDPTEEPVSVHPNPNAASEIAHHTHRYSDLDAAQALLAEQLSRNASFFGDEGQVAIKEKGCLKLST